jgi:hypothetical protein
VTPRREELALVGFACLLVAAVIVFFAVATGQM